MNRTTSFYLDFVRFFAALLVFFHHAKYVRFNGQWLHSVGVYGHDAVILFFVLSGFVIAYISSTQEKNIACFWQNRFARLYSVVIPALLITVILDSIGVHYNPSMYEGSDYQSTYAVIRFFTNLFFVNEIWFQNWRAFSNGPFWSLSYEFWYYVIFSCYFHMKGKTALILAAVAALIAGPKILLLFPIWILGALLYYNHRRICFSTPAASILVVAPLIIYILYRQIDMPSYLLGFARSTLGYDFVQYELMYSRNFLSDYIVGVLFSAHLLGILSLSAKISVPLVISNFVRLLAGMTFTLYLLHYPLIQFFGSFYSNGKIIVMLTLLSVALLAPITEGKKQWWREKVKRLIKGGAIEDNSFGNENNRRCVLRNTSAS